MDVMMYARKSYQHGERSEYEPEMALDHPERIVDILPRHVAVKYGSQNNRMLHSRTDNEDEANPGLYL